MNTNLLSGALKRVFGNGSVNNIVSSSLVPYCNASGVPDGLSSIGNLASVLGVVGLPNAITLDAGDTYILPNSQNAYVVFQYSVSDGDVHIDSLKYYAHFSLTSGDITYSRETDGGPIVVTTANFAVRFVAIKVGVL